LRNCICFRITQRHRIANPVFENLDEYLLDYGHTEVSGIATQSLSLYRDPAKGALVFGAGTVMWSWGLEADPGKGAYLAFVAIVAFKFARHFMRRSGPIARLLRFPAPLKRPWNEPTIELVPPLASAIR
jgi:hypothetical protein